MQKLNIRIAAAMSGLRGAKKRLAAVKTEVQAKCKHHRVAETPWKSLAFSGGLNPLRICLSCGYEEEGSHWSGGNQWSEKDYKDAVLGNKPERDVLLVNDRDSFYMLRLPI
ncbi:hypothetical protein [Nitrosovibrio sp. Nv4]|uniref:hypothetical protein n=1 Tax=Nitrosovibrio sp. Nv4 TaxID=1945880 RepID=UPI000BDC91D0|nr:hypothetical protein [Nitrosovibrio sp. Nv4]SOD41354.1 hypothetical protein SAMN06298226_1649 [Nitrosovibrio sp. Nv4]SOD41363.1 hypothetical protein SAMN06298226_1658 [Nitrosovibrio sp. Nv4]